MPGKSPLLSMVIPVFNDSENLRHQRPPNVRVDSESRFVYLFRKEASVGFAIRAVPLHLLYYLYSLLGFVLGYALHRRGSPDHARAGIT